jgi:hypothetical protein
MTYSSMEALRAKPAAAFGGASGRSTSEQSPQLSTVRKRAAEYLLVDQGEYRPAPIPRPNCAELPAKLDASIQPAYSPL